MELHDLKQHIDSRLDKLDGRLDRLDEKLDNHLARISAAETSIVWIKGFIKVSTGFVLTVVTGLLAAVFNTHIGK